MLNVKPVMLRLVIPGTLLGAALVFGVLDLGRSAGVSTDSDGDGFSDVVETSAGTDPLVVCGVNAWPPDTNDDTYVDIFDISTLAGSFGDAVPPAPARYDIAPDPPDHFVDITDIAKMSAIFGRGCVVGDPVFVGAGDIASCTAPGDEATATLLDGIAGTVFTAGDNAYPNGAPGEFTNCYDPTWGRVLARTRPATGNHDYNTTGATGYYGYFGAAAGDASKGYYSYNLGAWHIIVLNSNCWAVGGCGAGSLQEQWLRLDLAASPTACALAIWHHPRFSSGTTHGSDVTYQAFWQALYDLGADVVINGHEHNYERFALQNPSAVADPAHGIREFVIGSGGVSHYTFGTPLPRSEVRNSDTFGVLKLTLHATGYDWQFVREAGKTFTDSGSQSCH